MSIFFVDNVLIKVFILFVLGFKYDVCDVVNDLCDCILFVVMIKFGNGFFLASVRSVRNCFFVVFNIFLNLFVCDFFILDLILIFIVFMKLFFSFKYLFIVLLFNVLYNNVSYFRVASFSFAYRVRIRLFVLFIIVLI